MLIYQVLKVNLKQEKIKKKKKKKNELLKY